MSEEKAIPENRANTLVKAMNGLEGLLKQELASMRGVAPVYRFWKSGDVCYVRRGDEVTQETVLHCSGDQLFLVGEQRACGMGLNWAFETLDCAEAHTVAMCENRPLPGPERFLYGDKGFPIR